MGGAIYYFTNKAGFLRNLRKVHLKEGHQAEPLISMNVPGPPKSHVASMGNRCTMSAMGNHIVVSAITPSEADFRVHFG